jgi:hypothetical protein
MPNEVNLDEILGRASIAVEPEETVEDLARLKKEGREHTVELVKGCVVFALIILALISIGALCVYEGFLNSAASSDTQRWAQTTLSALFAGCVSFVLGQMTAKKAR